jgi:cytochrome oxidase assembly protein ShyY1
VAVTLALVMLGISLGDWQMRRAAEKQAAQALRDAAAQALPLSVPAGPAALEAFEGRKALAQGRLLAQSTVYIDNRTRGGVAGVHVVTPLELEPGGRVVLILRGWVASDPARRSALPPVVTPAQPVQIEGLAQRDIGHGLELPALFGRSVSALPGPTERLWTNVDVDRYAQWSGLSVQPFIIRQTSELADALQRDWPKPGDDVQRHHGYATQWYGLSIVAVLFWLASVTRAARKRRAHARAEQVQRSARAARFEP